MADTLTRILEATTRLVARRGARDLDLGDVALEADLPLDTVRSEFPTFSKLLHAAFGFVDGRATSSLTQDAIGRPAIERLRSILLSAVHDSSAQREDWIFWMEMEANALYDTEIRRMVLGRDDLWSGMIVGLILAGQKEGSIPEDVDAEEAGARLEQVQDGFGRQWALGIRTAEQVRALVEEAIAVELRLPEGSVDAGRASADRRMRVCEAIGRMAAERGVRGLYLEEVADAAGVPVEMLKADFGTMSGVLRETFAFLDWKSAAQLGPAAGDGPLDRLRAILLGSIDDAPAQRERWFFWIEMESGALFDSEVRQLLREHLSAWNGQLTALIRLAQEQGLAPETVDAEGAAGRLKMALDGFAWYWLVGVWPAERARKMVDETLAEELGIQLRDTRPEAG